MSPFPRNVNYREPLPHKTLNLQIIIVIMLAVQMVLTIWMWIDLHDGSEPSASPDAQVKLTDQKVNSEPSRSVLNDLSQLETEDDSYLYKDQIQTVADSIPMYENPNRESESIRLQILNGCGVSRVAAKLEQWIKDTDVSYIIEEVGNADRQDYANTIILDRTSKLGAARSLADRLEIDPGRITNRPSGATKSDLTIIIGKDFKRLSFVKKN